MLKTNIFFFNTYKKKKLTILLKILELLILMIQIVQRDFFLFITKLFVITHKTIVSGFIKTKKHNFKNNVFL